MKLFKTRLGAVVVGSVAVLALTTSCATTAAPGGGASESLGALAGPGVDATSKTITIGDLSVQSGPAAFLGTPVSAGIQAHVDAVNAAGGIEGWNLEVELRDTAYNPQKTVQLFNAFSQDIALLNVIGSSNTDAVLASLEQQKLVTSGVGLAWTDSEVLAPLGTPYAPEAANLVSYVAENVADEGAPFAVFYQNDGFGESSIAGYHAAVEELGLNSVAEENYKPGDADFSAQASRLKESGAEYVLVASQLPPASGLIGSSLAIGYEPTWILLASTFGPKMITEDGTLEGAKTPIGPSLLIDSYAAIYTDYANEDAPGYPAMRDAHEEFASGTPLDMYFAFGWSLGTLYASIIEKAIADGDLSREGVLKAKQSLGLVDMGGIVTSPTYTDDVTEPPSRSSSIAKINGDVRGFLEIVAPDYTSDAAAGLTR